MNIEFITAEEVLEIHEAILEKDGGSDGIRDENLLLSALANPQNLYHYKNADIFLLAASYAFSIVKNHSFVDGNKRTGFQTMDMFLLKNNIKLKYPDNTDDVIVQIATNDITMSEFESFLTNLSLQ